jgi:hypothetical protein
MPNPIQITHGLLDTLFRKVRTGTQLKRGTIIRFSYGQAKHDAYPMVIVTDFTKNAIQLADGRIINPRIRGLNLNYFTANEISKLITGYCGNTGFSYRNIMGDREIRRRFRHYKWMWGGINNLQILDSRQIIAVIDIMRAYDPNQADAIKKAAKEQLQRKVNVTAEDIANQHMQKQMNQQPMNIQSNTEVGGEIE